MAKTSKKTGTNKPKSRKPRVAPPVATPDQATTKSATIIEQSRPLLQVENIRDATGGDMELLEARDQGYLTVEMPNFWDRAELSNLLRDVLKKPDKNASLESSRPA